MEQLKRVAIGSLAARIGSANVTIFRKSRKGLVQVGDMPFRVKMLPLPEPAIGMLDQCCYSKKMLIAMGGLRVLMINASINVTYEVLSYKATIVRNDSVIAVCKNTGARYNPDLVTYFERLEVNDRIMITDIFINYPDRKSVYLPSILNYTITE